MLVDALLLAEDAGFQIQNCALSQLPTQVQAYAYFDDRMLAILQTSDDPKFAEAQALLRRISTKPYYHCIGSIRMSDPHATLVLESEDIQRALCARSDGLSLDDILVYPVNIRTSDQQY